MMSGVYPWQIKDLVDYMGKDVLRMSRSNQFVLVSGHPVLTSYVNSEEVFTELARPIWKGWD